MDWFGAVLTVLGLLLNAGQSIWCWPVWIAGDALWIAVGHRTHQPAIMAVNVVFVAVNLYGWRKWATR